MTLWPKLLNIVQKLYFLSALQEMTMQIKFTNTTRPWVTNFLGPEKMVYYEIALHEAGAIRKKKFLQTRPNYHGGRWTENKEKNLGEHKRPVTLHPLFLF